MMFEKYTVIKAVISTKVLLRQLHKVKDLVDSLKVLSELYKNVSIQIWANQISENFFESLILAQDERWRRA